MENPRIVIGLPVHNGESYLQQLDFGQNSIEFAIKVREQVAQEGTSLMRRLIAVSPN